MSGKLGSSRRSRSRSPVDDYAERSLLAKVSKSELKSLNISIRRRDVIGSGSNLPLERSVDDPSRICSYVHYRKGKSKIPELPIFGKGIKVNQDFPEDRTVFTHEKEQAHKSNVGKSRERSRSRRRSSKRSRSRGRSSSRRKSRSRNRSGSRERNEKHKNREERRSRSRQRSKYSHSSSRSHSRSVSPSNNRHKHKKERRARTRQRPRYSRSPSRSRSRSGSFHLPDCPNAHEPNCEIRKRLKKSLTPLRPGEYRPGHPDLALRYKRQRSRSRSRSYDNSKHRSRKSPSRDTLPSSSRHRSPVREFEESRRYQSPVRSERRDRRTKSRSPVDRGRKRSRSPLKRSYKSRSPGKRSRSPHRSKYSDNIPEDYGYFEGWIPGRGLPTGRGAGFSIQPFYAPAFHPRGMIPGPFIPPGHMLVPRMPMMPPYGHYRPHLPIYNSGAVRQRGPRPNKPSTITSGNDNFEITISEKNADDKEVLEGKEKSKEDKSDTTDEKSEEKK